MKTDLELISQTKSPQLKLKLTLPRYPLPQMSFKSGSGEHGLEVRDITASGFQVENKLSHISWKIGDKIHGTLKCHHEKIQIDADVIWIKQNRAGLKFNTDACIQSVNNKVLDLVGLVKSIKSLHESLLHEKPLNLKYWLQASGPLEFMVWGDQSQFLSSCLWVYSHFFVQWTHVDGLKTGKIFRQRDEDEWNLLEGECVLIYDENLNQDLLSKVTTFMKLLDINSFYGDDYSVLKTKLSLN